MGHQRVGGVLSAVVLALAAAAPAAAQGPSSEPEAALMRVLEPGDRVTITALDGSIVRGRLVEVGAGDIRVRRDGNDRRVAIDSIDRVRRTRMGLVAGPVIGAATGMAMVVALARLWNEPITPAPVLVYAGIGAGIGLGIDAALNLPRTVYQRDRRLVAAPIVTRRGGGVGLTLTF